MGCTIERKRVGGVRSSEMRKIKQTKSYMSHEFSNDAIPLPGFRVFSTVLPVRYQLQSVREADLPRHRLQKVHAKTIKPRVPRVVFFIVHHHVRNFLYVKAAGSMQTTEHHRYHQIWTIHESSRFVRSISILEVFRNFTERLSNLSERRSAIYFYQGIIRKRIELHGFNPE